MSNRSHDPSLPARAAALALVACAAAALALPAVLAGGPGDTKIHRQIGVMEKIIDKVLLDSPNFLVHGGENTRGLYLEEVGALFTFDASLTNADFDVKGYLKSLGQRFETRTDEDGNTVIILKNDKKKGDEDEEDEPDALENLPGDTFDRGREELIQTLLDYGETLTSLQDNQSIIIAAFVQGAELARGRGVSQVVLRARMADVRAHADGKLSEREMRSRVTIEES